ncbi:hypothetical protein AAG570_010912 [Ranatra chinensis]|uniref:Large ribosomal subunit protein bL17m n=1 Tax=Ranatra chinensis TaxID=642074 RepID=A0ABD0Z7F0_9HEMI
MNQADVSKLVSRLRIKVNPRHRNLKNPKGPEGRLEKLRKTVTGLIKHERIELNYNRGDEARAYAERLISEAIRYGDRHIPTMEMADYWLEEKQLVHKLFKVLVPRFENHPLSYTRIFRVSSSYPDATNQRCVLELRGNPYPPLLQDTWHNKNLIHNVLLDAARKDYRESKYAEFAKQLGAGDKQVEIGVKEEQEVSAAESKPSVSENVTDSDVK